MAISWRAHSTEQARGASVQRAPVDVRSAGSPQRAEENTVRTSTRTMTGGATVAAIALLLGGSALSASATAGQESSQDRTMRFHVLFSPFNYTDLGAPGPSAADVIVFHDQLQQSGKTVGDEVGSCVLVDPKQGLANCTGVVRLDKARHHRLLLRELPAAAQGPRRHRRLRTVPHRSRRRHAGRERRRHRNPGAEASGLATARTLRLSRLAASLARRTTARGSVGAGGA